MYTASFVPYRTAFIENEDPRMEVISKIDFLIDIMYILDFCINFLIAYEDRDKKIETRLRFIAINYIKTWFFMDLVSCIPVQYLEPE
jgi:hypothetical protein